MNKNEENSQLQAIASLLGLLVPILQVLLNYLPNSAKNILIIRDYFFFISIIAAVFSYIMVLIFKNIGFFHFPLSAKRQDDYLTYLNRTNPNIFDNEEVKAYASKNKAVQPPVYLTQDNISYIVFLPVLIVSYIALFIPGLLHPNNPGLALVLLQSTGYILLVSMTTLILAIYYIKDQNIRKNQTKEANKYRDVIRLVHDSNAFEELPNIQLIAQFQSDNFLQYLTILKVNTLFYRITTDFNVNKIISIEKFSSLEEMRNGK